MSSTYGERIKISVFGESHGNGIGVVVDGLPAGVKIDMDKVLVQMARRAPGKDRTATPRLEKDFPNVLSGMLDDTLTGAPLCAVIENTNTLGGRFSFNADTAFIHSVDNNLYIGKDNTISCLSISK